MAEKRSSVIHNDSVAAGDNRFVMGLADPDTLVVTWRLSGTGVAVGNLTNPEVRLVSEGDVLPTVLTPEVLQAPVDLGDDVVAVSRYNVTGLSGVEVRAVTTAGPWDLKITVTHYWS